MPKDSGSTSKSRTAPRSAAPARNAGPGRGAEPLQAKAPARNSGPAGKTATAAAPAPNKDLQVFDKAVALFNSGEFGKAKELFESLKTSGNTGLAHAAESRALMCGRRLGGEES